MKITFESARNEPIQQELLDLIKAEVRTLVGQEIRELVREYMAELNLTSKMSAVFADLVSKQIESFTQGHGRKLVEDVFRSKLKDLADLFKRPKDE